MQTILEDIGDQQSISFLRVLQGFLNHKLPKDINSLGGMYSRAADRILNQVRLPLSTQPEMKDKAERPMSDSCQWGRLQKDSDISTKA